MNHEEAGVRRRVAIGLAELADLYSANQTAVLEPAIQRAGLQLSVERDAELQGLISAAFVRLAQEAIMGRRYRAVLQSLDSIDSVENQRPTFAQSIRPRLGIDQRLADFIEEAVRTSPGYTPSLIDVIGREAPAAALELVRRFNRSLHRAERERIVHIAAAVGPRLSGTLRETLQVGQPTEASDFAGLLMCLDPSAVEGSLASRLAGWSQIAQDRALRLVASSGAPARGRLLLSVFDQFDPMLQPLALDEMGMSGETSAIDLLLRIASGAPPREGRTFLRLKAAEALGRLRASQATGLLQEIVESKKLWQWQHPSELRLTAFLALRSIAPAWAAGFYAHSGFTEDDIHLGPRDSSPEQNWLRQRRHLRIRLKSVLPATATSGHETISLQVRSLSLSGGAASGEKHVSPGTLVALRLGTGLRPIRAQALMRGARAQALSPLSSRIWTWRTAPVFAASCAKMAPLHQAPPTRAAKLPLPSAPASGPASRRSTILETEAPEIPISGSPCDTDSACKRALPIADVRRGSRCSSASASAPPILATGKCICTTSNCRSLRPDCIS